MPRVTVPTPLRVQRILLGLCLREVSAATGIELTKLSRAERNQLLLRDDEQLRLQRFYQSKSATPEGPGRAA